jgi:hypothetical protein
MIMFGGGDAVVVAATDGALLVVAVGAAGGDDGDVVPPFWAGVFPFNLNASLVLKTRTVLSIGIPCNLKHLLIWNTLSE